MIPVQQVAPLLTWTHLPRGWSECRHCHALLLADHDRHVPDDQPGFQCVICAWNARKHLVDYPAFLREEWREKRDG